MTRPARRWTTSYRFRLAAGYVVLVALFAVLWAWSLYGPLTDAVIDQQRGQLTSVAQAGAVALAETGRPTGPLVEEIVSRTDLRMTVVAADGRVLADSDEDPAVMENHADRPEVSAALGGAVGHDVRRSATLGIDQMYVAVPAELAGERVAVRVAESLERIRQLSAQARSTGLVLLGAALVLALALAARMTSTAAAPVERLARSACAMAAGDLAAHVPDERGALAPLSDALSGLRAQLRERIGALEAERENLRAVLDGLTDAVMLLDGDLVRVANAGADALSRSPSGVARAALEQTGLPAGLVSAIREALEGPGTVVRELGPDPLQRYQRLTVVPLGEADGRGQHLVVVSDTTDRMRLDSVRRDFVANASHELKTPASAIQLLAEAADAAASDGDTEQALTFMRQIRDESSRLQHLVLDLLDLSRLEAAPAPDAVTDMRQAVDLSLAAHRRAAGEKGLALNADFAAVPGEDVYAAADPTDVAIALDNLLANAIAYTERGSVGVAVSAEKGTLVVRVSDTGIGIPAADLPRVFERFYRVDRARSRESGGTGLGLALVRHVAERSGGRVDIASEEGRGTTVALVLPRAR
ncbi:MAG: ATP-binding protein [Anaerosomatales bacterium]|nr:ATP-binding protein [Anaerosomatales bacterium]